jgi:hypothetical protein
MLHVSLAAASMRWCAQFSCVWLAASTGPGRVRSEQQRPHIDESLPSSRVTKRQSGPGLAGRK